MSLLDDGLKRFGLTRVGKGSQQPAAQPAPAGQVKKEVDASTIAGIQDLFVNAVNNFHQYKSQEEQLRAYTDWVYAATRAIAEDAATIDLRLYVNRTATKNLQIAHRLAYFPSEARRLGRRKVTKYYDQDQKKWIQREKAVQAIEELDNHQLLDLLNAPNAFMTKDEFFELTYQHMELSGEAFWIVFRGAGNVPEELWPVMPYRMKEVKNSQRFLDGWVYTAPSGKRIPFDPEDVIHHKYMNPSNPYRGFGVVQAAARAVDTDAKAADSNRNLMDNAGVPDIALKTEVDLKPEQMRKIKQQWADEYANVENAHKVAVLDNGLDIKEISLSPRDLEYLEGRRFNRDQILALFRVSAHILGISENVNRANAEAAETTFAKRVIKPKMQRLTNRITVSLAPQFDAKLVVGYSDPVPEDKEYRLKERESNLKSGVQSINEVREDLGMEGIPGGEEPLVPLSSVPLSLVGSAPDPEEDPPAEEDEGQEDARSAKSNRLKKKLSTPIR